MADYYPSMTGYDGYATGTTNRVVWTAWNYSLTNQTSTGNGIFFDPWAQWSTSYAATTVDTAWFIWNDTYLRYTNAGYIRVPREMSEEEVAAFQEAERERREKAAAAAEERRRKQAEARERARELLLAWLDEPQRAEYEERKQFHVTSKSGRRYCIKHGRQHNVFLVNAHGTHVAEYCGHVGEAVPDEDNILAQALLLTADEDAFLAVANRRALAAA